MLDYDQLAADYAEHRRVHPEVLRQLIQRISPETEVLEVGCGTGNYLVAVQQATGCRCFGVDQSQEMLREATRRSSRCQLVLSGAEVLPFPDARFDVVFSVDVIHHVINCDQIFRETFRVLRSGGLTCTTTDSEWIIRNRQPLAVYFPETVRVDLARYPPIDNVWTAMSRSGFTDFQETEVEFTTELTDIAPYRTKAFSCLRLISEDAFQRGLQRMQLDLIDGPIPWVSRYVLLWGRKTNS